MPVAVTDGIATHYELVGSGPPLLMFSPGGFNATLDNWSSLGRYRELQMVSHLSARFTCILFDRRESGRSGGRVERIGWGHYVAQAKGLLDHLGITQAHTMGGCAGCSVVAAFALAHPEATRSMVFFSPAGGVRYRMGQHARFASHAAWVEAEGLQGVVALAGSADRSFSQDARVGPWAPVLRRDPEFAARYANSDRDAYLALIAGMSRLLFDRDTVPGAEPEDLLGLDVPALVIPGHDDSHATSAARYLEECLPAAQYWDVAVEDQTEPRVAERILSFLAPLA